MIKNKSIYNHNYAAWIFILTIIFGTSRFGFKDQTLGIIDSLIYILINGKQSSHLTNSSKSRYGSNLSGAFLSINSEVKSTN